MRVPDVPAYLALPKSCGANPTPIAFAEVYLALQNGTVDAQENPLTTIEAKKFYEVQKYIILTGHIVDSLATQIAPHVWSKLSDEDKKIFTEVTQEAAAKRHRARSRSAKASWPTNSGRKASTSTRRRQEILPGRDAEERELRIDGATSRPTGTRSRRSSDAMSEARHECRGEWQQPRQPGQALARRMMP